MGGSLQHAVTNQRTSADAVRLSTADRQRLLSRLVDEFERRGWREDGHAALALVSLLASSTSEPTAADVDRAVGRRFQVQNEADPGEIRAALAQAIRTEIR